MTPFYGVLLLRGIVTDWVSLFQSLGWLTNSRLQAAGLGSFSTKGQRGIVGTGVVEGWSVIWGVPLLQFGDDDSLSEILQRISKDTEVFYWSVENAQSLRFEYFTQGKPQRTWWQLDGVVVQRSGAPLNTSDVFDRLPSRHPIPELEAMLREKAFVWESLTSSAYMRYRFNSI